MDSFIKYGNCGFTTRNGGYSTKPYLSNNMGLHVNDKYEDVIRNREHFAKKIGFELSDFVISDQQHTDNFYRVELLDKGKGAYSKSNAIPNNDALYTFENNIVLATFHADCVPVYFFSKKHNLIGVIHAGWVGTEKQIVYKTLNHIINEYNINPDDICVHFGPSISQKHYEVQEDVVEKFKDYTNVILKSNNKFYLDTTMANVEQLNKLNIKNITFDNNCTFENEDLFFSYRRDGITGRMIAYIYQ